MVSGCQSRIRIERFTFIYDVIVDKLNRSVMFLIHYETINKGHKPLTTFSVSKMKKSCIITIPKKNVSYRQQLTFYQ